MKIRKAVIPAAGLGTRFLPATKTVPKELLPIVDTPIVLHVVREAIAAGIEDLILISGRQKHAIEDFFDRSYELEDTLLRTGKEDLLEEVRTIQNMINVVSIRQKEAKGLGHAVYTARPAVGDEPFAVLLGDEVLFQTESHHENVTEKLAKIHSETGLSTVAVMEVAENQVDKYGIIAIKEENQGLLTVDYIVEKPDIGNSPSSWALPGRYVFTAAVFDHLKDQTPGKNGEIQLTDAMTKLASNEGLLATPFRAQRYDAGDKLGYLMANVERGLLHPEIGLAFREYLKKLKL